MKERFRVERVDAITVALEVAVRVRGNIR